MKKDLKIKCIDCGTYFTLTVSEQQFFLDKGLFNPRRCKGCRERRKPLKGGMYHPLGGEHQ